MAEVKKVKVQILVPCNVGNAELKVGDVVDVTEAEFENMQLGKAPLAKLADKLAAKPEK